MAVVVIRQLIQSSGRCRLGFWIQDDTQTAAGVTFASKQFTVDVTSGNFIVVFIRVSDVGRVVTVTDDLGNTYAQVATQEQTTDGTQSYAFLATGINGGTCTVTVAVSGAATTLRWEQLEYFTNGVPVVDQIATAQADGALSINSGNITITQSTELLIASGIGSGGFPAWSVSTGWTLREIEDFRVAPADRLVVATGVYSVTFSVDIPLQLAVILFSLSF